MDACSLSAELKRYRMVAPQKSLILKIRHLDFNWVQT